MPHWAHMLEEFAIRPDPMTWHEVKGLRMTVAQQQGAVMDLVSKGFIKRAGLSRQQWKDTLFRITPAGLAYWEEHVKGKRRRPRTADPVPRYSVAHYAVGTGPRDVFDLDRVPWTWDRVAEGGEPEPLKKRPAYRRRIRTADDYLSAWRVKT